MWKKLRKHGGRQKTMPGFVKYIPADVYNNERLLY